MLDFKAVQLEADRRCECESMSASRVNMLETDMQSEQEELKRKSRGTKRNQKNLTRNNYLIGIESGARTIETREESMKDRSWRSKCQRVRNGPGCFQYYQPEDIALSCGTKFREKQ